MAFGGRSGIQEPIPDEATGQTLLDRVNAFGERHARAIIVLSTALIIVTVLIFAQVLWNRTLFDRVERDLTSATSVETLEVLRKRYAGSAAEPRILATLGHRYAVEGKLAEAKAVYTDFLSRHSGHVLAYGVNRSLAMVEQNLKFLETGKAATESQPFLDTHPLRSARVPENPLRMGPVKEKHPTAVLKFKGRPDEIRIELFEDEAPNAVAAFVSLAERKYFDGLAFTRAEDGARVRISAKKENPSTDLLAVERTVRPGERGAIALVRRDGANAAAEFEILLKPAADAKDLTIFGRVFMEPGSSAAALLEQVGEKDEIESLVIDSKRDHEYKPVPLEK